jgi:hypothetical protein
MPLLMVSRHRFVGLLANALLDWWWADPMAALAPSPPKKAPTPGGARLRLLLSYLAERSIICASFSRSFRDRALSDAENQGERTFGPWPELADQRFAARTD